MNDKNDIKRLFFGLEVHAPWPQELPEGRVIEESSRHLTLAFLGNVSWLDLKAKLPEFPKPPFALGTVGLFDHIHFLPPRHPHVVAWHVSWLNEKHAITSYPYTLWEWLRNLDYNIRDREFLPHVTVARAPFSYKEWRKVFKKIPMMITNLHLYETTKKLTYKPVWSYPMLAPFTEIEHTGDLAFTIRGTNIHELSLHAQTALAFEFPYLRKLIDQYNQTSLEEIIIHLNELIRKADEKVGCPFKAVSFHGEITKTSDNLLEWEMIVDV